MVLPGGGGGQGSGWSGAVLANHSEGLARILEGVTGLQMEMMETKLRVNNMAARMGELLHFASPALSICNEFIRRSRVSYSSGEN